MGIVSKTSWSGENQRKWGWGWPYPLYFWELEEARLSGSPRAQRGDIAVKVKRVQRTPNSYGAFIHGYSIASAHGQTVAVIEDRDGDEQPELSSTTVTTQYLKPDPDDLELAGMLTPEDEETLTRVQTWVNQLNASAKSEYQQSRRGQKSLPASGSPLDRRLAQAEQIQRKALSR